MDFAQTQASLALPPAISEETFSQVIHRRADWTRLSGKAAV